MKLRYEAAASLGLPLAVQVDRTVSSLSRIGRFST